jgi:hypothetical protein
MKKSVSSFCLFVLTVFIGNATYAQSNFSSKVIGVGVVVSDMERSLDFYLKRNCNVKTRKLTNK